MSDRKDNIEKKKIYINKFIYTKKEKILDEISIGNAVNLSNANSHTNSDIGGFANRAKNAYPEVLDNKYYENDINEFNSLKEKDPSKVYQTPNSFQTEKKKLKKEKNSIGTTFSEDAVLSKEWIEAAISRSIHPDWVQNAFEDFKDYWTCGKGEGKKNKNWLSVWRNWCGKTPSKMSYPKKVFENSLNQTEKLFPEAVKRFTPDISDPDQRIASVKRYMLSQIGDESYISWIQCLDLKVSGSNLNVYAPSAFVKDWVSRHYADLIQKCSIFDKVTIAIKPINPGQKSREQ